MQSSPTEAGFYWARKAGSTYWDHIVKIQGEKPFFNYIAWYLKYPTHESSKKNGLVGIDPIHFTFGDRINEDYKIFTKLAIPEKRGLYWATGYEDFDNHVLLVYIKGKAPYISCFTWDTVTNLKKRELNGGFLSFLKYIDEPTGFASE